MNKKDFPAKVILLLSRVFNISQTEVENLHRLIREYDGHLNVVMHPNTILHMETSKEIFTNFFIDLLSKHISQLHSSSVVPPSPTILFMDEEFATRFLDHLEKRVGARLSDAGIYIIMTKFDYGVPNDQFERDFTEFETDIDHNLRGNIEDEHLRRWFALTRVFGLLGVKSITASGGFIGAYPLEQSDINRCLGDFIKNMRMSFPVDISEHSIYKDGLSREYLKSVGYELNQVRPKNKRHK